MYSLTAFSLFDGFTACWAEKFRLNLIRPVTYINRYMDPKWEPLLQTPPFPEHASGHSTITAAAAEVLTQDAHIEALKLFGPLHANVALGTPDEALMVTVVMLQLSNPPVVVTSGGVVFPVTVAVAVLVQPLLPSVTVTT